jgi:hypothetical protein
MAHQDATRVVYRPGAKTFLVRLGWTAVAAFVVRGLYATTGRTPLGDLQWIYWGLVGLLAALGIVATLSCLWNRIAIVQDGRGNIAVGAKWGPSPIHRTHHGIRHML